MDRKQGAAGSPPGVVLVQGLEIDDNKCGLPVMGVEHVGLPVQGLAGLERGPSKEGEAREIIGVISSGLAIETGPREKRIVPEQEE